MKVYIQIILTNFITLWFSSVHSQQIDFLEPLKTEVDYFLNKENIEHYKSHKKSLIIIQTFMDERKIKYEITDDIWFFEKSNHCFFQTYNDIYVFFIFADMRITKVADKVYDGLAKKHFPEAVKHLEEYKMYPPPPSYHPRRIIITVENDIIIDKQEISRD